MMKVEIAIDPTVDVPTLVIHTATITEEVQALYQQLTQPASAFLTGWRTDGSARLIEPSQLVRVYAEEGKVIAVTDEARYTLRLRLYELENRLPAQDFVRISHSEIIHLKKVSHFDLNITATICVHMTNGDVTYVSRRYVKKIKQRLEL